MEIPGKRSLFFIAVFVSYAFQDGKYAIQV